MGAGSAIETLNQHWAPRQNIVNCMLKAPLPMSAELQMHAEVIAQHFSRHSGRLSGSVRHVLLQHV